MNQDVQHIKLLSIFHYVVGVLMGLFACIPIFHFGIGVMMIAAPNKMGGSGPPPPPAIGWIFVLISAFIMFLGWTAAICLMVAGWFLPRYKHYLFCMIVAGIACLFQPFGTVLGVFTFIVLLRPSVKRLFETGGHPAEPPDLDEPAIAHEEHVFRDSTNIRME
jgi:hypothetical protein